MNGAERLPGDGVRTGLDVDAIARAFCDNLFYVLARFPDVASLNDEYQALAHTVRDRLLERWVRTAKTYKDTRARTVCYFSAEYLPGPHLAANMLNLGITAEVREAMTRLGMDLDQLVAEEEEPGLGNGGLGRLAACYMESMATLRIPAIGYGIRYEFGIFDQAISDGWQVELADHWLHGGNPWEIRRPRIAFDLKLGGHTEAYTDEAGRYRVRWTPERLVRGVAYDTPILGHGVDNANLLRLWGAEAPVSFDLSAFNVGDYYRAVEAKVQSESLSKVLYPNDEPEAGKQLRLEQQYFFVSCSLQDMIRIHRQSTGHGLEQLADKYVVQLNDTHPAIAVAELMRLLVDENDLDWDSAWRTTQRMVAFTNHTLLPEALERWPVALFRRVLPRHLEIVYEINRRFLDEVRKRYPGDEARVRRLSLLDESDGGRVRMAHLACVGSHAVNGVAEMHTELLTRTVLADFHALWPERFSNKTNGVSPRRFLMLSNPPLADLLTGAIGDEWKRDLDALRAIEPLAEDAGFREEWRRVKHAAKTRLAGIIRLRTGVVVDPDTLFDIQVKRIHEYKRQHLNVLHVITLYNRLRHGDADNGAPRTVVFAGKAAPSYRLAKLVIKLIHSVAAVVNGDPAVAGRLRVVFLPDFNVKHAQNIYPAADLSEQISLAGMEASGTGNMKFTMNGALTIGTLDGANVEIRREVGAANFFLFGHTAEEVATLKRGGYDPGRFHRDEPALREALDMIADGAFSNGDRELFRPLVDALLGRDDYLVLADYRPYVDTQTEIGRAWGDAEHWTRMSVLNVARCGRFSADRAVREYAEQIWQVPPVQIAGRR